MGHGRTFFGISHIGYYIYVVGGVLDNLSSEQRVTEKYHIKQDKWDSKCPELPDKYAVGVTTVSVKKRYVYGFGGCDCSLILSDKLRILCFDTLKAQKWQSMQMKTKNGYNFGAFVLSVTDIKVDFLLFGGYNKG